jgi:hypothetical protein
MGKEQLQLAGQQASPVQQEAQAPVLRELAVQQKLVSPQ